MRRLKLIPVFALVFATGAYANLPQTFTATNGSNLSASATFEIIAGGDLQITLTNTGYAAQAPGDVLTAIFFNIDPNMLDVGGSAKTGSLSSVVQNGSTIHGANFDVSGEYAFRDDLTGLVPNDANAALGTSSAGFGLFGAADRLGTTDLSPPAAPNGINYGLVNTVAGNANNAVKTNPLITNSVVITLYGSYADNMDYVTNVFFQYGTVLSEGGITPVPVPAAAGLCAIGLGLIGWAKRRLA